MEAGIFVLSAVILFVIFIIEILILAFRKPRKEYDYEYHNGRDLKNIKNHIEEDSD